MNGDGCQLYMVDGHVIGSPSTSTGSVKERSESEVILKEHHTGGSGQVGVFVDFSYRSQI